MTRVLSAVFLIAALAVVGCGSSKKSSSNANTTPAATTAAAPATTPASTPSAGGQVDIKMKNIQFSPASTTVKVGQTVKWTNADSVDHNVTATAGESFKSSNFGNGKSYSYKVDKPGTIKYSCTIHPGMNGTITVTK